MRSSTAPRPTSTNTVRCRPILLLISTFNSANLPTSGVALGITGIDNKLKTSYVYRYSLEAQYDLGHEWVATLGYSGSSGRHLPLQYNLYDKYAAQILAAAR